MADHWWFKEYAVPQPAQWTWRTMKVDGSIGQQSREFPSYGAAVHDAIINGFRPTEHRWAIESTHLITHFEHGRTEVVITKNDNAHLVPPPGRASLTPSAPKQSPESDKTK
jgi:hypothetical protein